MVLADEALDLPVIKRCAKDKLQGPPQTVIIRATDWHQIDCEVLKALIRFWATSVKLEQAPQGTIRLLEGRLVFFLTDDVN